MKHTESLDANERKLSSIACNVEHGSYKERLLEPHQETTLEGIQEQKRRQSSNENNTYPTKQNTNPGSNASEPPGHYRYNRHNIIVSSSTSGLLRVYEGDPHQSFLPSAVAGISASSST